MTGFGDCKPATDVVNWGIGAAASPSVPSRIRVVNVEAIPTTTRASLPDGTVAAEEAEPTTEELAQAQENERRELPTVK